LHEVRSNNSSSSSRFFSGWMLMLITPALQEIDRDVANCDSHRNGEKKNKLGETM